MGDVTRWESRRGWQERSVVLEMGMENEVCPEVEYGVSPREVLRDLPVRGGDEFRCDVDLREERRALVRYLGTNRSEGERRVQHIRNDPTNILVWALRKRVEGSPGDGRKRGVENIDPESSRRPPEKRRLVEREGLKDPSSVTKPTSRVGYGTGSHNQLGRAVNHNVASWLLFAEQLCGPKLRKFTGSSGERRERMAVMCAGWTLEQLEKFCRTAKIPPKGTKNELIARVSRFLRPPVDLEEK